MAVRASSDSDALAPAPLEQRSVYNQPVTSGFGCALDPRCPWLCIYIAILVAASTSRLGLTRISLPEVELRRRKLLWRTRSR